MDQKHPTLLVVDDDLDTCATLDDVFSELGFQVDSVSSGIRALDLVRRRPFDLVLLDLKMPEMDGLTLYREIKKLRAGTAVFMMTGIPTNSLATAAISEGILNLIPKPVDIPEMLTSMNHALSRPLLLILGDDRVQCSYLWDFLHQRGHRVCIADNECQALQRIQERQYKLILINMDVPNDQCLNLFHTMKVAAPDIRTVVVTGFASESDGTVQELLDAGTDAVFCRPLNISEVLAAIDDLAHTHGMSPSMPQYPTLW